MSSRIDAFCLFFFPWCYGIGLIVLFNTEFRDSYASAQDGRELPAKLSVGPATVWCVVFTILLVAATLVLEPPRRVAPTRARERRKSVFHWPIS